MWNEACNELGSRVGTVDESATPGGLAMRRGRMRLPCDEVKANLPEILVEWHAITCENPWLSMPADARIDHLPDLIHALNDAALCLPNDSTARLRLFTAAATHGKDRRIHGFPDKLLLTEHYLLREAMWRYLRQIALPDEAGFAIMLIDSAITLASRASLYGYHESELEALGHSMPELIAELIQQWPTGRGDAVRHEAR